MVLFCLSRATQRVGRSRRVPYYVVSQLEKRTNFMPRHNDRRSAFCKSPKDSLKKLSVPRSNPEERLVRNQALRLPGECYCQLHASPFPP